VAIFLHGVWALTSLANAFSVLTSYVPGFPDSFLLWRHVLQSSELLRNYTLIAVDLPGYGGSDSLPTYGPYDMLEALTEFFIGMRKLYLHQDKQLVAVTHDWGAVIGARLASEAKEVADHWIITSGLIVWFMWIYNC